MRNIININENWKFIQENVGLPASYPTDWQTVNLPHTWNALDGQDGGNDYKRGTCTYETKVATPVFDPNRELVYLQFYGVNASATVILNGTTVITHDGGYSTFRVDVTDVLLDMNDLVVKVDNSINNRVYPQMADFTFYGGIYRDVEFLVVSKDHFDLDYFGGNGLKITPKVKGESAEVRVESYIKARENAIVKIALLDAEGKSVATGVGTDMVLSVANPANGKFCHWLPSHSSQYGKLTQKHEVVKRNQLQLKLRIILHKLINHHCKLIYMPGFQSSLQPISLPLIDQSKHLRSKS